MATVRGDGDPGVHGTSQSQTGVYGTSNTGWGVHGMSNASYGVHGQSDQHYGVRGGSNRNHGVVGETLGSYPAAAVYGKSLNSNLSNSARGVVGETMSRGTGVRGSSEFGYGVEGISRSGNRGVSGYASAPGAVGVFGTNTRSDGETYGVRGEVSSRSDTAVGVYGKGAGDATGVRAHSERAYGVFASSDGIAVAGYSKNSHGVVANGGSTTNAALYVTGHPKAGHFNGHVTVQGDLTVENGNKPFKIDHPLDPKDKYLLHHSVESSERKNVYDGVAQLDEEGAASVDLPEWFEALNGDFRYQLTAVGGAAPNLHVAEEIYENRFKIGGGEEGMKVCWQVTGSRKDPWAAANPFEVEEEKPQEERGLYLEPSLYGAPEEQNVMRARTGEMRELPQEPSQAPEEPPSFEPPEPSEMPPGGAGMPPSYVFDMQEEHRQQIDELRGQIEELKRGRMEDEQQRQMDDLRRQIEELRRRRKR